jgi:HK97 family phage prohead protease
MEVLHKLIDCEVKKLNDLTYEFIASTEDIDRDGEVIEVAGWDLKNFKKNPVITFAHDYRSLPVGKSTKVWVADKQLRNYVEFPAEGVYPFADTVRRLVDGGFLRTESVGFRPAPDSVVFNENGDGIKTPYRRYTKQELLEISIVPVPSNPNALIEAKTKGIITDADIALLTKQETSPVVKAEEAAGQTHEKKAASQADVIDEIDYLKELITEVGLNDDALKALQGILVKLISEQKMPDMAQMKKMHGMMAECETMAGKAKEMAQGMMDDMKRLPGDDIPVKDIPAEQPPTSKLDRTEVAQVLMREIAKLRGKIN